MPLYMNTLIPLQFCYQFYAFIVITALFAGVGTLAFAILTLYGMGGVELVIALCFVGLYGLIRVLLPPVWISRRGADRIPPSSSSSSSLYQQHDTANQGWRRFWSVWMKDDHRSGPNKVILAIDTYVLEEKEQSEDDEVSCRCCPSSSSPSSFSSSCCPICLNTFQVGDTVSKARTCGHMYHEECLAIWLSKKTSCPYCRQDLEIQYNQDDSSDIYKPPSNSNNNNTNNGTNGVWGIFDGIFDSMYT